MFFNINYSNHFGFSYSFNIGISAAYGCPDEVDDCMVVTPDENDRIDTGSGGGGIIYDGGGNSGGGSVGSGNGGDSGSGSENPSDSQNSGTIDSKEQCQIDALVQKNQCLNVANVLYVTAAVSCPGLLNPYAIAICEGLAFVAWEDQKGNCELEFATTSAKCD